VIGLLTGTFDPVHRGHVQLAEAALVQAGLEEVWLLANPDPAHKVTVASFDHRQAMCALALVGRAGVEAQRLNREQAARPHVWRNFRQLEREFADRQFEYIVGVDTMLKLATWEDAQSVVRATSYIVMARTHVDAADWLAWQQGPIGRQVRWRLADPGEAAAQVSSTVVRQELAAGQQPEALDAAVFDYIRRHRLYGA